MKTVRNQSIFYLALSLAFITAGYCFYYLFPQSFSAGNQESSLLVVLLRILEVLGHVSLVTGGSMFIMLTFSIFIRIFHPEKIEAFFSRIGILSGVFGALSFAIPAAFMFPGVLFLRVMNVFPDIFNEGFMNSIPLWSAVAITLTGWLVLIATLLISRARIRATQDKQQSCLKDKDV